MVKSIYLFFMLALMLPFQGIGQESIRTLSLQEAYQLLEKRYPALKDAGLITAIHQEDIKKIEQNRLPELYLKGQAQLQSENVSIDLPEGSTLPLDVDLPLYSARTFVEAQYAILDGQKNEVQKDLKDLEKAVELQRIEVNRFALRERINQLFVNIEILRSQEKLFVISLEDLAARKKQLQAAVEEGVALSSEVTKIEVKILELEAQQENVQFQIASFRSTLEDYLGQKLSEDIQLIFPSFPGTVSIPAIQRPEQRLFQLQSEQVLANAAMIDVRRKPQLNAFAQTGIGYPNPLNLFDNNVAPYGIIGLQFNWKITDWKRDQMDKTILSLQAQKIQNAQATFEFNLQKQEAGYRSNIERLEAQLAKDNEIANLQANILEQLAVQLEEGVITASDYVVQVNAELRARQNILIHQSEILKNHVEFWNSRGAF
ncbi:MAG: TolC family protein [Bacteroidota bacterium]